MRSSSKPAWQQLWIGSALLGFVLVCLISAATPVRAASGINQQLNFQGRLLNSNGATVPDGVYNLEFKIYQDGDGQSVGDTTGSPAGTLKWTEDHLVSTTTGVTVRNGFLSVQLGSVTAFGTSIDWNQDALWLSVNIGNTSSCTIATNFNTNCGGDGEMTPMKRLTSSPYALNSYQLGGLTSSQYVQLAQGLQTEAGNSTSSIAINKTGTGGNFIKLQAGGNDAFTLNNSGDIAFGANANHSISVATAGSGVAGKSLTVSAGTAGSGGSALAGGDLTLQGGSGGGTNGNGGNITIDAGAPNGSGTGGTVSIGAANASGVNIATNAAAHTVAIANGAAVQGITIGSTNSTSSLLLQAGTGNLSIQTQGGTLGIGNNAVAQTIQIGNGTGATAVTVDCGTGTCAFGTTATAHATNVGSTNGASSTTLQGGTGGVNVATGGIANTVQIGNTTGAVVQTINIGNNATGSSSSTVVIGSTIAGNITLQSAATINIGQNSAAQTINIGNTTGATGVAERVGTGNYSLDGVAGSTYTLGASTTTGTTTIGGTAQTGAITLGSSTGANTVNIANGSGAGTVNIANVQNAGSVNIGAGMTTGTITIGGTGAQTGTIGIGTGTGAQSLNFGTGGTAAKTVTVGSTASTSSLLLQSGTGNLSIQTQGTGTLGIGTNAVAQVVSIGNTTGATSVTLQSGSGGINLNSSTIVAANFTVTNAGNVAFQKGTDYSTTGSQNNVNFGSGALIRLTGSSAQTITGIAGGADGRILTLVNAASQSATISNLSGSSSGANQISTGSGGDATLPAGASISLVYDSGASLWRVIGASSSGGSFVQLQGTTPGTFQSGNINVNGSILGSIFDVDSAVTTTLAIGTSTASTVNIATNAAAHTIAIGNGAAVQGITIGSTNSTSSLSLQAGTGGLTVQTQGGTLGIANNSVQQSVVIGNTTGASNVTVFCGTGSCSFGGGAAAHTTTIGTTNSTATTTIQGGTGGVNIGTGGIANTIQIGTTTGAVTQTINIGTNATASSTTNITIGSGSSGVTAGATTVQAKDSITIATNAVTRATFDNANNLYLGNGLTAAAPNNFVIQGTGSTTTAVAGGSITLQGGNATVGNANGGNITLSGGTGFGTGVTGITILATPSFQTVTNATCGSNCNITQANIDSNGAVIVNATASGLVITLTDPTIATAGRVVYVTAANGSNDFTLRANTGAGTGVQQDIAMRQNTTATMIWNGSDWTAAGASSSTTLQSAYDSTLTSAGAAELILSNTSNHNGLTIRDSLTSPVSGNGNGTLLEVQTAQAASLFSVNSNVTDYANNAGAESAFGSEWAGIGTGGSVSRNTASTSFIASGIGSAAISTTGTANTGAKNVLTATLTANLRYNVSFTAKLSSGSFTDLEVDYSKDGTNTSSAACASNQTVPTSVWVKVNCTFTASSSGITSSNAILIRQTAAGTRTWYVDNLSVTISADLSYATDGSVDDNTNFGTNWVNDGLGTETITRDTTTGNDASDSAKTVITAGAANAGIRNKLSINPLTSTLYRVSVYVNATASFTDFKVRYSRDGSTTSGGNYVDCVDYNTQTISTTANSFTQVTCYITTDSTAATSPYVYFVETASATRTYYVDTFSMTLASNAVPNVQVGGGVYGGPTTLFTLDRAASAPIAANNDALLGSMYYDTTLGKLQCYESDGWGACGSSPDNIITISPEYTNAVLHGSGVGTMTSDLCSDALNINDGSGSQPTICGTNETFNFYKWTSPQANAQTYSIYVTYQLPSTFKSFSSGTTSLMGRTDSTNATVQYSVYRNRTGVGLTQCGSTVAVSTGSVSSWQTGVASGAADPSTCSFGANDSIVFKIDMICNSNANAYVGNLGFTFSNK